jgi:hypothetical protein
LTIKRVSLPNPELKFGLLPTTSKYHAPNWREIKQNFWLISKTLPSVKAWVKKALKGKVCDIFHKNPAD